MQEIKFGRVLCDMSFRDSGKLQRQVTLMFRFFKLFQLREGGDSEEWQFKLKTGELKGGEAL